MIGAGIAAQVLKAGSAFLFAAKTGVVDFGQVLMGGR